MSYLILPSGFPKLVKFGFEITTASLLLLICSLYLKSIRLQDLFVLFGFIPLSILYNTIG